MLLVVLIATASCDSTESDEPIDFREKSTVIRATPDDPPPSATPVSGAITLPPDSDWNWQLTGELKMTVNAEAWDVDLFDTAPEEITQLHQDGKYVICYFSAGSVGDWRPDAGDVDENAIVLPLDGWEGECWLNVCAESVLELAKSRLQLAAQKGCDAVEPDTRIVFITNPHSPSGTWLEEADVRRIVEAAPHALVALDEAYVHYSETPGHIHLAKEYDNLIVLRTFSKSFGLAGLRLGFGVAHRDLIPPLLAVKPTWNVGRLQIVGGIAALTDDEHVDRTVAAIIESRLHVNERFGELDRFRLVPGTRSNFMLIEILDSDTNSTKVFNGLLERGVIVKDGSLSFRGLGKRYLRSDINLPHRMDRLVDALADLP